MCGPAPQIRLENMDGDFQFLLDDDALNGKIDDAARSWLQSRVHAAAKHHASATPVTEADVCARDPITGDMLHDMDTVLKFNALR